MWELSGVSPVRVVAQYGFLWSLMVFPSSCVSRAPVSQVCKLSVWEEVGGLLVLA